VSLGRPSAPDQAATPRWRLILRVGQAFVSIGLIAYLLQLIDWRSVEPLATSGALYRMWPAPLLLLCGTCFAAVRWQVLLGSLDVTVTRAEAFRLYLISFFYSVLLPGVLGGDVVRMGLCAARTKKPVSRIFTSILTERLAGLWGLTILGSVAVLWLGAHLRESLGWAVVLASPLLAMGIPLVLLSSRGFGGLLSTARLSGSKWAKRIAALANAVAHLLTLSTGTILGTVALGIAFQASEIAVFVLIGSQLNLGVPVSAYFAIVPVVYLATLAPVSLGGLGVREGVLTWLMAKLGVLPSDAVILAFLVYLNRIVFAAAGGLVQMTYRSGRARLPETARDTEGH